jgi:peroxiredoxin Q/BCP
MRALVVAVTLLAACSTRAAMLHEGDLFPAWTMKDHTGKIVSSSDLAGRTYLLWFYPKAQTPGCTAEGRGLRDQFDAYKTRDVEILGVSFDTPEANAKFVAAEGFPFRLLSDEDHALATKVGAADDTSATMAKRISYVVGPDGKVLRAFDNVNPASHAGDVLRDLVKK